MMKERLPMGGDEIRSEGGPGASDRVGVKHAQVSSKFGKFGNGEDFVTCAA